LPFLAGVLGSILVIGICFGIPTVKDKIFNLSNTKITAENENNNTNSNSTNLNLVSLSNYSDTSVGVAEKVLPSIVGIQVEYSVRSFFGGASNATAQGSGIIISEDGYILTNNHIVSTSSSSSFYEISDASKVTVFLYNDETPYEATIVGKDEETDLAVIKLDKTGLTPAVLGDSNETKIGEFAMAVGNPLGLQSSITVGIISATNREVTSSDGQVYTAIQTDAAINSGNSGGALVNSKGEVIGINTLKLTGNGVEGIGFAIPISSTIDIYEQLIQYNKVRRPYIGITGLDLNEKTAEYNNLPIGIYIREVEDFSAAQLANIKVGDVIIKADGKDIKTMNELDEIKFSHKIGDEMTLTIVRDGKEKEITLTLKEEP